jgi:hypothetical protein
MSSLVCNCVLTFLVFHDLDSSKEHCSGILKNILLFGLPTIFLMIRLGLLVWGKGGGGTILTISYQDYVLLTWLLLVI